MLLRRLAPPVAALAVLGLTGIGCADQSAAAKVGDRTLSEKDLMDEVELIMGNDALWAEGGGSADVLRGASPDSVQQEFVGQVLNRRIQYMVLGELLDEADLELTEEDLTEGRAGIEQEFGTAGADFPDSYQDQLAEDNAAYAKVQTIEDPRELREYYEKLVRGIEVSSRYGSFDAKAFLDGEQAVQSPAGPEQAPGGAGGAPVEIPAG